MLRFNTNTVQICWLYRSRLHS